MANSNDDTQNRSASIRDQLRVITNNLGSKSPSRQPVRFVDGREVPVIETKCNGEAACGLLTCEVCSASHRLEWIRQTLAITKAQPGQHEIATIYLGPIPAAILVYFDVKKIREHVLACLLEGTGFQGELLRGGIDVTWELNAWLLYAHALAIDVPPHAWARLRAKLRNRWPHLPNPMLLKVRRLRTPERQISSLLRFHTYFWPRSPTGAARAETPPADDPTALADWASDYTFKDFTFQFRKEQLERISRRSARSKGGWRKLARRR